LDQNTYYFGQSDHYSHEEQMVYEEGYTHGWNFVQPSAPPLEWSPLAPLETNEFAQRKNLVQLFFLYIDHCPSNPGKRSACTAVSIPD
jgi:hypothetical protein